MGKGTSDVTVVGRVGCSLTSDVVDYLTRNSVVYRWVNIDQDQAACQELGVDGQLETVPLVKVDDFWSVQPDPQRLAELLGIRTEPSKSYYDVAIIGAGPAGLSAAVVGASEGLSVLLIESRAPGGQVSRSHRIENYLGFGQGVSGPDLGKQGREAAERLGAEFIQGLVWRLHVTDKLKTLYLGHDRLVYAGAVIVATGLTLGKLEVPGAADLEGSAVYYGSPMSQVQACRGEHVAVVGGGNSAGQAALCLAETAGKVTVVIRSDDLADHMSHYLVKRLSEHEKVEVLTNSSVSRVEPAGEHALLTVKGRGRSKLKLEVQGLFVFIGSRPNTTFLPVDVRLDQDGYILTGELVGSDLPCETSVPGVFACGDIRSGSQQRVATAVGDGTVAINSARQYLRGERW